MNLTIEQVNPKLPHLYMIWNGSLNVTAKIAKQVTTTWPPGAVFTNKKNCQLLLMEYLKSKELNQIPASAEALALSKVQQISWMINYLEQHGFEVQRRDHT